MKSITLLTFFLSVNAFAAAVEVYSVNPSCPNVAVIRQTGEYFKVRAYGCFLAEGLEGTSLPDLRLGGRSQIQFDDGSLCTLVQVVDSSFAPPADLDCH